MFKKRSKFTYTCSMVFIFCIGYNTIQAQSGIIPTFGIKGGVTISTLNDADEVEIRPGLSIGGYLNLELPVSSISIQPEVLYSQFGTDFKFNDSNMRLDYIQLPLLFMYEVKTRFNNTRPYFFAGPYISFLSNTISEGPLTEELRFPAENGGTIIAGEAVDNVDYGIVVGTEVNVSNVVVGLRYNAGIKDVFENNVAATGKNSALSLIVGVAFN